MLDHLLRKGDRVVMKMGSEDRAYGRKGVPDGTNGTIVGRHWAENIIECRYPRYTSREPGVYAQDGVALVEWDGYPELINDPDYSRVSSFALDPTPEFINTYQERYATEWPVRNSDGSYNHEFDMVKAADRLNNRERTGDLPETPFWELDIVEFEGRRYRIYSINYFSWGSENQHSYSMEEISDDNEYLRNGTLTVDPAALTLIERGNVWKEAHNEPLVFGTLEEEVAFSKNMGRATQLRNPKTDFYSWSLEEVLDGIQNGTVDGFTNEKNFFSDIYTILAWRFHDRELGERVRQETLKGFDREVPHVN